MKVKFHLPDFAGRFRFNMVFAAMLNNCPQFFREGVEIASVYGTFRRPFGMAAEFSVAAVTRTL